MVVPFAGPGARSVSPTPGPLPALAPVAPVFLPARGADVSGVLFEKNQVKLRYEGRYGFAVLRPSAFVEIDLAA